MTMTDQPTAPAKRKAPLWLGYVTLLALILACVGGAFAIFSGGDTGPDSIGAEVMCEQFVKDRLKAPATAEFPKPSTVQDGLTFTVTGAVDAENSFGAKVRTRYVCQVTSDTAGATWTLNSLTGLD